MKKINKQLDINTVRRIMDRDPITKVMIQHFAQKERSRAETSVESLTQLVTDGRRLTRGEVITSMKSLETAGAGVFYAGRRGKPSRFQWACDLVKMAKDALAVESKPEATPEAPTVRSEIVAEPAAPKTEPLTMQEPPAGTKTYFFPLRSDRELHVELPMDLSKDESARLAQFVQSLGH